MLTPVILAAIVAKLKKYSLKPLLTCYALYPFFIVELVYWFFQINVFFGNYKFITYATELKNAYLYILFLPIIVYKLYAPALLGSVSVLIGTGMNRWVMYVNGGKMPVYPTISRYTRYYNEKALTSYDSIHSIGNADTKWKILTDYIDVGWSVLSIGDLFIHAFAFIIIYFTIKKLNTPLIENKNG